MRLRAEKPELQGEMLADRMKDIADTLKGWYPRGGLKSLRLFQFSEASNWSVLPYQGGWLDQPEWVADDFEHFLLLAEWHELNRKLPKVEGKNLKMFGED